MAIQIKRVYAKPAKSDGLRILVDRLWPRGLTKEAAQLTEWMKEIAPSNELRHWYEHDPAKWEEFQKRYARELEGHQPLVDRLRDLARTKTVTLLFSSKAEALNNAAALKNYLEQKAR